MTEERKIRFEKYLRRRVYIPERVRSLKIYYGVPLSDYEVGKRCCYVNLATFGIFSQDYYNSPIKYIPKLSHDILSYRPRFKNIYRAEYVGPWKGGFFKRVDEFYFSLPWFKNPNPTDNFVMQYGIIKKRMMLRRLLYAKKDLDCNDLFYNALLDLFGPNEIFSIVSLSFTPIILAKMCRAVMYMSFRELIDKCEKDLDWLMEHTRPKSGLIINRDYNHGQFKGSSGAAKGRKQARKIIFQGLYSEKRTSKENIEHMKDNGLNISYSTYLKYKKEVINVREPIKELDICY